MTLKSKKKILIPNSALLLLLFGVLGPTSAIELVNSNRSNTTYGSNQGGPGGLTSIFSPRMDFEQWKPLTGRGDPLRNDPTYDYEPPVLERVHYWADDTKPEREHYPEKKSEVLMLGVSSRKPSATSRQPPLPTRRHPQFRPPPPKYEDFTYKLSDSYPMTILVPPPLPPPGHQQALFILNQAKPLPSLPVTKVTDVPQLITKETTDLSEKQTALYALQASNLIYQSSTVSHNWIQDINQTLSSNINNIVSSDYAGWGPTTPLDEYETTNETYNLISNDHSDKSKHPYSFYKPMFSESPPPLETQSSLIQSTFQPTALPPTPEFEHHTTSLSELTWPTEGTTYETTTENHDYYDESTTEKNTQSIVYSPPLPTKSTLFKPQEINIFDMLGPMMSMPIINGPDRPEDNFYAHASESMQIYKESKPEVILKLESMQTMQPPPPIKPTESSTMTHKQSYHANSNIVNTLVQNKPTLYTHDPYLNMGYTKTPISTTPVIESFDKNKSTTEASAAMYLIIQGHSKVKTYSSKPKPVDEDKHTFNNEIPKPNETTEVKHLHPKEKFAKKLNITETNRKSKAQNLKSLVDHGHGSIEIQEADIGIKYDVSDGSDVPLEVYRKGIVDNDENNYKLSNKISKEIRTKRQIELDDLLPFDEDSVEEYVYNFFEGKKNDTSFTGLIAQAVTSDAASAVDELEEIYDDTEIEEEDR